MKQPNSALASAYHVSLPPRGHLDYSVTKEIEIELLLCLHQPRSLQSILKMMMLPLTF